MAFFFKNQSFNQEIPFSKLAIAETIVSFIVYWLIAIFLESHRHLLTSIIIAPLLLLRSEKSKVSGATWYANYWREKEEVTPTQHAVKFWVIYFAVSGIAITIYYYLLPSIIIFINNYYLAALFGFSILWITFSLSVACSLAVTMISTVIGGVTTACVITSVLLVTDHSLHSPLLVFLILTLIVVIMIHFQASISSVAGTIAGIVISTTVSIFLSSQFDKPFISDTGERIVVGITIGAILGAFVLAMAVSGATPSAITHAKSGSFLGRKAGGIAGFISSLALGTTIDSIIFTITVIFFGTSAGMLAGFLTGRVAGAGSGSGVGNGICVHAGASVLASIVFGVPWFIGLWIRSLGIRFLATVRYTIDGIRSLPNNYKYVIFNLTIRHPPDLVPGVDEHVAELSFHNIITKHIRSNVGHVRILGIISLPIFFISIIYRLNLKSTFWLYWPLAFLFSEKNWSDIVTPEAYLKNLFDGRWENLNRVFSIIVLMFFFRAK